MAMAANPTTHATNGTTTAGHEGRPPLTALASGVVGADGEPSRDELEERPKRLVYNPAEKVYEWKDPLRRAWLPRPDAHDLAAAAIKTFGPERAAKMVPVAVATLHKVALRSEHVLWISIVAVAAAGPSFARYAEELGE